MQSGNFCDRQASLFLAVVLCYSACGAAQATHAGREGSSFVASDSFEDASATAHFWTVDPPKVPGMATRIDRRDGNSFMSLTLPSSQEVSELTARRTLDLASVRGHRVRLSARVRTLKASEGVARLRLAVSPPPGEHTYSDFAESGPVSSESWMSAHVVVDVHPLSSQGTLTLILSRPGTAWFDDVRVTSLGPSPVQRPSQLPTAVKQRVVTLTRALALVRYFHPSDQSATADWSSFSVAAFEMLLRAPATQPVREVLARIFADVAPTARFVETGSKEPAALPRDPSATHLVRWHHVGLGSDVPGSLYHSFRDGIHAEEQAYTEIYSRPKVSQLSTCRRAEIRAAVRVSTGAAWVFVTLHQSGHRASYIRQAIENNRSDVVIAKGDVPTDVQQVQLGIFLQGRTTAEISNISFKCENGQTISVDARSDWEFTRYQSLYDKQVGTCAAGACLTVRRLEADTALRPDRDIADVDLGGGVRMLLPAAVWSDGKVTFPRVAAAAVPPPGSAISDLPVRLAAVATIWGTLSWFYPYFGDQRIDWLALLPRAFEEVAAADSPERTHDALSRLIAGLQDGHARVRHPTQEVLGMLPIALRRFDDKFAVIGGLPEYLDTTPVGSEIVAIDGMPTNHRYASNYSEISAATPQFREYLATLYLSIGRIGSFKHLRVRTTAGSDVDVVFPLVSRQQFDSEIGIRRPKSGSEVAPSIYYLDPRKLDRATLPSLIQTLKGAHAVILDLRGLVKSEAFDLIAHFISQPVASPTFRSPVVSIRPSSEYEDESWLLWPAVPRLTCRLIVLIDARAVSAIETVSQIVRDHRLGVFVGEPTAGTNGNVSTFSVPGGFEVRFTGLRTSAPDNSTIQGHGITPDHVVHPTLDGIRTGRDEILEAGIAAAQHSGGP